MQRWPTIMALFGSALVGLGCPLGDSTVTEDDNGSLYTAEVFCDDTGFEGVRISMVVGPNAAPDAPPVGTPTGCVQLFLAQGEPPTFEADVNFDFVVSRGQLIPAPDCSVRAVADADPAGIEPLTAATGSIRFDGGPEQRIRYREGALTFAAPRGPIPVAMDEIEMRTGACDPDFDT